MKKLFLSIFLLLLLSFVFLISYLSFYGYETDRFNNIIKSEIKKNEKNIDLDFKKISILLDIKKLTLFIKFIDPEVEYQSAKIPLDTLKANIDLVSNNKFFFLYFLLAILIISFAKSIPTDFLVIFELLKTKSPTPHPTSK